MGATTICVILAIMPSTLTGNRFPSNRCERVGVTTTAVMVESAVMTILRGAMLGSTMNVA